MSLAPKEPQRRLHEFKFTFKTNGKTYSTYGICNRSFRFHDYPFYEKNKYLKSYVNLMVTLLSRANPKKKEKE